MDLENMDALLCQPGLHLSPTTFWLINLLCWLLLYFGGIYKWTVDIIARKLDSDLIKMMCAALTHLGLYSLQENFTMKQVGKTTLLLFAIC